MSESQQPQPDTLSQEEIAWIAAGLEKLEPGYLPFPIFMAVARLVTMTTIEFVAVRRDGDEPEIMLARRPDDDPLWPRQWHLTGTILRATDAGGYKDSIGADYSASYDRVVRDEFPPCVHPKGPMQYVTTNWWRVSRGTEYTPVFLIDVAVDDDADLPEGIQFFPLNALPADMIEHHRTVAGQIEKYIANRD